MPSFASSKRTTHGVGGFLVCSSVHKVGAFGLGLLSEGESETPFFVYCPQSSCTGGSGSG